MTGESLGAHIVPCCVLGQHIDGAAGRPTTVPVRPGAYVCADCGRSIERHPDNGWWAHRDPSGVWSFTCRFSVKHSRHHGDLEVADYHYVRGEQRAQSKPPG
jgi:hypothetical protein